MSWNEPQKLLWLLALLPLAGWVAWSVGRASDRRVRLLGGMAAVLAPGFSGVRRLVRDGLVLIAFAGCVVALAEPVYDTFLREVQRRGVDVMVVLDSSRSMLCKDLRPDRLERARRDVHGLLNQLDSGRAGVATFSLGLVTFAGDARRLSPLTRDAGSFRVFLDSVDTYTNSKGGTAVGGGLALALDSFDPDSESPRVVILLTDGEDHMSDPPARDVAFRARAEGIPIHVIAYGTQNGAPVPDPDAQGGFGLVLEDDGTPHLSVPDERFLEEIASVARGAFLSADSTPFPLDELWAKRIAMMEGVTQATSTRQVGKNRFQWVLAVALLCLCAHVLVPESRPT